MKIISQPFYILYSSRFRESINFTIVGTPPVKPEIIIIHNEFKKTKFLNPKKRTLVAHCVSILNIKQSNNFILEIGSYGNESLIIQFKWPNDVVSIL